MKQLVLGCLLAVLAVLPVRAVFTGITVVASSTTDTNGGTNVAVTDAINSTGANLCVVVGYVYDGVGSPGVTVTDSKGNTYTPLIQQGGIFTPSTQIFYTSNPTVGTSHIFTITAAVGNNPGLDVICVSGAASSSVFDVQNGAVGSTQNLATGTVNPGQNGEFVVSGGFHCCTVGGPNNITADSGTPFGDPTGEPYLQSVYKIQTTATAENITYSLPFSPDSITAVIATFKPASGAGASFLPSLPNLIQRCCK